MRVHGFSLYDMLERNAVSFGSRRALVTETGEQRTFGELRNRVDALAAGLADVGLEAGDRISILAHNSASYLELYLACARLGSIAYPVNWRLTPDEVARILERARPRALVVDRASREALPWRPGDKGGEAVEHWLQLDGTPERGFGFLAELYLEGLEAPRPELDADAPFTVLATAAVDVIPRGAILSHGNLLASNLQEMAALGLGPEDGNLVALPLFHIAALGHCLAHLHAGAVNVIQPRWDAVEAVNLIDRYSLTHLSDFPPVLESLLDAAAERGSKLPSLRWVSGLDSPQTMERLGRETSAEFVTGFGQAETSGFVTLQRSRERPGAAGRPAELCRVELVDDYDREVPVGTPGEIVVRGPLVFQGYDAQPDVTEMTFRGGWHHTGDVGRFDEDGFLHYVKRKAEKELIKPGGENVYPAEVETVIVELAGVSAACVFGVPDKKWGEAIKAVVESTDADLSAETVIEHVGSRIARFKRPHHVEITDALPRTDDGSVDREAVKEQWGGS